MARKKRNARPDDTTTFNIGSYVLGIEYQNLFDNLDNIEDGNIVFTIGSVFN